MDVDERREATLIYDDTRRRSSRQLFIMNFESVESSMFIVCFYVLVCFVCLFVGLWCLKFAIQWRWVLSWLQ